MAFFAASLSSGRRIFTRHVGMNIGYLTGCCAAALILVGCGGGSEPEQGGASVQVSANAGDRLMDEWAAEAESSESADRVQLTEKEDFQLRLNQAAALNAESLRSAAGMRPYADVVRAQSAHRVPVYRFWNSSTQAHFLTTSQSERDNVIATLPQFNYEGVAFHVSAAAEPGLSPVYRYFNTLSGVHFFTISETEKNYIDAELPELRYEGIAYYASLSPGAGLSPLYRFYQRDKGFHFYTVRAEERNTINDTLCSYSYEGVGYYVLEEPPAVAPAEPVRNRVVLLVGDSLSEKYLPGMDLRRYRFVTPGRIWADQLERGFGERTGRACDRLVNVSVGGRRTRDGLAGLPNWLALHKPTHVIVAQGTNDAWGSVPLETIESNLNQMVSLARNAGAKPYVMEFAFLRSGNSYRQSLSAVYRRAGGTAQASYIYGTGGIAQNTVNYHPDLVHLTNTPQPTLVENAWQVMRADF